ncbi:restriction endonuclease subunit S [Eionea flava]
MSEDLEVLPEGWERANLFELCTPKQWKTISKKDLLPAGYVVYGANGAIGFYNEYTHEKPTLMITCRGASCGNIHVSGPFSYINGNAMTLDNLAVDACQITYLQYFLIHRGLSDVITGTAQPQITQENLKNVHVNLSPYNEQTRIVDKLEELLSDLDNGVAELKTAQAKLTQYRQSLLKSAVEGTLTQQWREENADTIQETGKQLLARILKERRQRWEQKKREEFAAKNKTPPKDWQKKYPEPVKPDTSELPELPEGWVWASLDMLGDIVSGVTKGTKRKNPVEMFETAYLRVANVQRGYLNLSEIKTIPASQADIEKYTLLKGDILFNEGGDRDKLGRGWVWYGEVNNCIHQNHVFRMRPFVKEIIPELVSYYGNTFGKLWFQNAGKQTTNLASINKGVLQSFPVPLSPYIEQLKISELLSIEIDNVDHQIKAVESSLNESEAQRKNILKDAFSGKLVPQDSNDESASVLLEKIKAERALRAKAPKPKRPKKKVNPKANIMETLLEVLKAKNDWIDAQEAFRACGVGDGTDTDRIEALYAELRHLDKVGRLECERHGYYDMIKLKGE